VLVNEQVICSWPHKSINQIFLLILSSNKQGELKLKLGVGNQKGQREEIEPLEDLGPASGPPYTLWKLTAIETMQDNAHGNLVIPFARSATMQTRSFSVVGPKIWNGLPVDLRDLPNGACSKFHHLLKTSFPLGLGRERL